MKKRSILTSILITTAFLISLSTFGQKPPSKFGHISKEEMKQTVCPIDSNAHAYYIFDYGHTYFKYASTKVVSDDPSTGRKGFQIWIERHFRIKILDKDGLDMANFSIPLYHNKGDEEVINSIRGRTYNLVDGKIEKSKLKWKDVIVEETSEHWNKQKFTMPDVHPGSIIEVEYTIVSDYPFNLNDWHFQRHIPVLQSDYYVKIPEYYKYNQKHSGYHPIETQRQEQGRDLTITYEQKDEGSTVRGYTSEQTLSYIEEQLTYHAKNIPAFYSESYLKNSDNYMTKVEFELEFTKFPNRPIEYYTSSWETINKNLMDDSHFGRELNNARFMGKNAENLKLMGLKDEALMQLAFDYIKENMVWNGILTKYTETNLKKAFQDGKGNVSDINLNLVVLARELGLEANPVLLSTQSHGFIHPAHPSVSSFDYVIALVTINGKEYLLDATDPLSEANILPVRCLNDKGYLISENGAKWIDIQSLCRNYTYAETKKLKLNEQMEFTGSCDLSMKDYAAYLFRKNSSTKENLAEKMEKEHPGLTVENLKTMGLDTLGQDIKLSYDLVQKKVANKINDMISFCPAYLPFTSENPFKLENRNYPVEYDYPWRSQEIITIEIPEGYEVSEIPKPLVVRTPDKSLSYVYSITPMGNTLQVSIMFSINKTTFIPEEYEGLKNLYKMIIDKQNELVLLSPAG